MKGSKERVQRVMTFGKPDHAPLFDLLPNDAVLCHFNGGVPVETGDDRSGISALVAATDSSRFSYFAPMQERSETLPDGRVCQYERWTVWTPPKVFASAEEYRQIKQGELTVQNMQANARYATANDGGYLRHRDWHFSFGKDYYLLLYAPSPGLMGLYTEVGLETFSYYLSDVEDVIDAQLEANTEQACKWVDGLPDDDPFDAVFIGEDIAFKSGPMFSPRWLAEHYFPRLKRVISAFHARRKKVVFHSDGNLNPIMDDLVAAGIDGLNPIEVQAGMDLADLHKRYPELIFFGGIDVSHLLPFGKPQEVQDAVVQAIEDTEGQILIGSSTEVMNQVPLENFMAMRTAAINYNF
ncbi:MAG: hypothetical protein NT011_01245 [Kiritimatiellaeota bacterium]|nr:hypothetical protein [Kiritimatiellota bacterium]